MGSSGKNKYGYGGALLGIGAKEDKPNIPEAPKKEDPEEAKRRAARRRRIQALNAQGYQGTVLTQPSGAATGTKSLLGQ